MLVDYCNDFPDGMNTKVEVEGEQKLQYTGNEI
jgi:hypothetical protein